MNKGGNDKARQNEQLRNLEDKLKQQRQSDPPEVVTDSESDTDESPNAYIDRLMRDLANRTPKEDRPANQ